MQIGENLLGGTCKFIMGLYFGTTCVIENFGVVFLKFL
jgi:hypothetical protein